MNKKKRFFACFSGISLVVAALVLCVGAASASGIDFDKAIIIGSGPKKVIEFTDPDCPFCRKAARYFAGRSDVTQYIFFWPLPRHPKAKEKAQYILSQHDKAKAYHEVMAGRLDGQQSFAVTPAGVKLLEEQAEIARKNKVSATPTFMLFGRIIEGFDQKKIEEALGR
ncbi:protein-disulfide isomerase [Geobacter sp. FeAm09]|uniref:thioredoxin fold domain-containing protein n=1 Tax=Geobacter sp. FeAm09 TaxID=2597769 RepID=UPI0011EF1730|nr:thioredoxin fold domain-containing protein [Geobacter sp. FeAm09]QEM67157.1 protein-disulfide isomerase [Geobacter sp. FeAm09]